MRAVAKSLTITLVAGGMLVAWQSEAERDVVMAQAPNSIVYTRIFAGADGQSHAEDVEMPMGRGVSEMMAATGVQFSRRAPSPGGDWHTGPQRQFVITLSGRAELELSDGKKVQVTPGHINLIEDTTGKGHITRNLGPDDRIVVTIPLADRGSSAEKK